MPLKIFNYDRESVIKYAKRWAYDRNPAYYNFDPIGGDCTNYVSQCIFAGSGVMNYTPVYGWYYINLNRRTPSWTGVSFLYNFLTENTGAGPIARKCKINELMPADIIQLKRGVRYTHTLLVTKVEKNPLRIYVATHTYDSFNNPLSKYWYDEIRFLHIEHVKKY